LKLFGTTLFYNLPDPDTTEPVAANLVLLPIFERLVVGASSELTEWFKL